MWNTTSEFGNEVVSEEKPKFSDHNNGMITRSINFQQKSRIPFLPLATEEKSTCQDRKGRKTQQREEYNKS